VLKILLALTPRIRVLLEELTFSRLVKRFLGFYRILRFITLFTRARQLSLPCARSIQMMLPSHFLNIPFNIVPSTPGSSRWFPFPQVFPPKMCAPLLSTARATCSTHLILLDMITLIFGEEYKTWSSSICNFLQPLYFLALMPKYLHQYPILEHSQPRIRYSVGSSISLDSTVNGYRFPTTYLHSAQRLRVRGTTSINAVVLKNSSNFTLTFKLTATQKLLCERSVQAARGLF